MSFSGHTAQTLGFSIRDGTFPETETVLNADLNPTNVPVLLAAITKERDSLNEEIRSLSTTRAGDVDQWISQANTLQQDIAQCKIEARRIIEEHERVESMRRDVKDANSKVSLLEGEIAFQRALEHEIGTVGEISHVLSEVENHLLGNNPIPAVETLASVKASIATVSANQTRSLLTQLEDDLYRRCRTQLQQLLNSKFVTHQDWPRLSLEIIRDREENSLDRKDAQKVSTNSILSGLAQLDALPDAIALSLRQLESFILPLLSPKALYMSSAVIGGDVFIVTTSSVKPTASAVVKVLTDFINFLHTQLPSSIRSEIAQQLVPKAVSSLISSWLDEAIPTELDDLQELEHIESEVRRFASQLSQYSWSGQSELEDWSDQIPRTWITKRRMRSLDQVRKAFISATGSMRHVERVERQVVDKEDEQPIGQADEDDDWNASWDDEPATDIKHEPKKEEIEDEASGWDFETDDSNLEPEQKDKVDAEEDEAGDAWGWNDESPTDDKKRAVPAKSKKANGMASSVGGKEMTLTEIYSITDIPDYILETIGKDLADARSLASNPRRYFTASAPTAALQTLPTLTLAMFRATAPTYYSHSAALSNMTLYNDTLYIVQKLSENPDPAARSNFQETIDILSRFARQTYTRELETQRTVLTDLLDGAQGFVSCTRFPFSQECTNAVSSVVDRIRQVHKEWQSILGKSHLLQSIGTLVAMVMAKIIHDIEDMEDISEAESRQLVEFCQKVSTLDDLFIAHAPHASTTDNTHDDDEGRPMSTAPLYVHNYLRFQYLTQILESSLVDIKYLWTEGELSLEFTAEEVMDLIKALFAESQHRRGALRAIRGSGL